MDPNELDSSTLSSRESYYGTGPAPNITEPLAQSPEISQFPETSQSLETSGTQDSVLSHEPISPGRPVSFHETAPAHETGQSQGGTRPVNGMAIASLVLGILSLLTFVYAGLGGLIFGGFGILLAFLSRGSEPMQSPAKVGLGLSIAGVVLGFLAAVIFFSLVLSQDAYTENGVLYRYETQEYR